MDAEEEDTSTSTKSEERSQITTLLGRATTLYARKNYDEAAEIYANACQLQEKLNGELATENAGLLYAYGRCLYRVAVARSDVLGDKNLVDAPSQQSKKRKARETRHDETRDGLEEGGASKKLKMERSRHVEINGDDAGWDSSDESEDSVDDKDNNNNDDELDQETEELDDDFANAWDILDMARCILLKKISIYEAAADNGKGKRVAVMSPVERSDKEMLADIFDLQAEIAMENEKFVDAVEKARDALTFQTLVFDEDSNRVAEAHFKLALALEFASVIPAVGYEGGAEKAKATANQHGATNVDQSLRDQAVEQMELSIKCTKLRVSREEHVLAQLSAGNEADNKRAEIEDVKEVVNDMEVKLAELRAPPVSLSALESGTNGGVEGDIRAMLDSLLGGLDGSAGKAKLEEVTKTANDLTSIARKKAKKEMSGNGNGVTDGGA